MKNSITIQFSSADDLAWAIGSIEKARARMLVEPCGTPLSGASASILLCALGRSRKIKSAMTSEHAKDVRLGKVTP
jgi:hypothetical protein